MTLSAISLLFFGRHPAAVSRLIVSIVAFILVSGFLVLLAIANGVGTAIHLTGTDSFPHPSATPYDEGWQPFPSPTPDTLVESDVDAAVAPTAAPVAPAKHTKRYRN